MTPIKKIRPASPILAGAVGLLIVWFCSTPVHAQPGRSRGGAPRDIGRKTGDPTDPKRQTEQLMRSAQKRLEEGNRLLAKGNVRTAKTKFRSVIELVGTNGPGGSALAALNGLHEEGLRRLSDAQTLANEKEFLRALKEAQIIKVNYANLFGGLPNIGDRPNLARKARLLIEEIEADPEAQAAIQEDKASVLRRKIERLENAVDKAPWKYYDLYRACRTAARRFPASETGISASQRAKSLKADRNAWRIIGLETRRREIADRLRSIEDHEKAGEAQMAKREMEKLLIKYPGHSRADLEKTARVKTR